MNSMVFLRASAPQGPVWSRSPWHAARTAVAVIGRALGFLASVGTAWAAPGDLDTTFGGDGKVSTAIFQGAESSAAVYAIAQQSDGKIVVAGTATPPVGVGSPASDFALARYNVDGSLDTSFSGDGKLSTDIFGGQDYAYAVAVQADGKILAAGSANANAASFLNRFALVRYNANGSLDTSFGTGGKVGTDFFAGNTSEATAIAVQADGKILVAGVANDGAGNRFALARYNTNGSLDTSFGTGGKVTTSFFGFDDGAVALALQPDGKIVAAGRAYPGSANMQFALARYNTDGSLDTSFGSGGKVSTDFFGANDFAGSITLVAGGKIVVAGAVYMVGSGADQFGVARYNADGSLDSSFGTGGKTSVEFSSAYVRRWTAAAQADGKIVGASWGVAPSGFDEFQIVRLNTDGSLDNSFGGDGKVTTSVAGSQNQAWTVMVQADGKTVAAGSAYDGVSNAGLFALTRYESGTATALAAPNLLAPANAATVTQPLSFDWSDVAGASGYEIEVDDSASFAAPLVASQVVTASQSSMGGLSGQQLWWRVRARNNASGIVGPYSAAQSFALQGTVAASLSSVSANPASVVGGNGSTGRVALTAAAPAGGAVITLSSNSSAASVPASVSVPAGASTANFSISTGAVAAATSISITAAYAGVTRSAALTLNPAAAGASQTLTVTATGRSGQRITTNPAGINVAVGTSQSASFGSGSPVTLSVASGRSAIWSGACSSGGNKTKTCTFTINGNATVSGNVQ